MPQQQYADYIADTDFQSSMVRCRWCTYLVKENRLGKEPDVYKQKPIGPVAEVQKVVVPLLAPIYDEAGSEQDSCSYSVHTVECAGGIA